ncbi:hypothetical protein [Clostridium sp. ZS2-4]|uniref:hypothetical protein n=1 Tax=Clostridium sp. ZS2-4 TaxID=2987703 RepID=UPI00227CE1B2|nr:hypothetical protein [Clostridium sp. ZS2-4]MCY6354595.1 hypothetical protein [Clostridium sp. ZS2-4]
MKKTILGLLLAGVLAFGVSMGTTAYYANSFTSEENKVHSLKWDVSNDGWNTKAYFSIGDIYPSENSFSSAEGSITRKNEIASNYKFTITPDVVNLIDDNSPIKLYFVYNGERKELKKSELVEGKWDVEYVENDKIDGTEDLDKFHFEVDWKSTSDTGSDNAYANKDMKIKVEFKAVQNHD